MIFKIINLTTPGYIVSDAGVEERTKMYLESHEWCLNNNVKIDICKPSLACDTLWFETEEDLVMFTLLFGNLILHDVVV